MPQRINSLVVQDDQPNVSANVNARMLMNPIGTVPGIQPSPSPFGQMSALTSPLASNLARWTSPSRECRK
jgi:hypothetical protein